VAKSSGGGRPPQVRRPQPKVVFRIKGAMALLDPTDPQRQAFFFKKAWDVDIPGNFFTSLPTPETRASGIEVCSMVAIYMGIEDPFLGTWFTTRALYSGIGTRPEDICSGRWARSAIRCQCTSAQATGTSIFTTSSKACPTALLCLLG